MVLDKDCCDLHTGVDGRSDGTAEWIPGVVIEPCGESLPAVVVEVFGGSEVEVWVEFMNNWSILIDRVETNRVRFFNNAW